MADKSATRNSLRRYRWIQLAALVRSQLGHHSHDEEYSCLHATASIDEAKSTEELIRIAPIPSFKDELRTQIKPERISLRSPRLGIPKAIMP